MDQVAMLERANQDRKTGVSTIHAGSKDAWIVYSNS